SWRSSCRDEKKRLREMRRGAASGEGYDPLLLIRSVGALRLFPFRLRLRLLDRVWFRLRRPSLVNRRRAVGLRLGIRARRGLRLRLFRLRPRFRRRLRFRLRLRWRVPVLCLVRLRRWVFRLRLWLRLLALDLLLLLRGVALRSGLRLTRRTS